MRRSTSWWKASSGELLALSLVLAACSTRDVKPVSAPSQVTLFFSADVRGYLGPCGCSENMRGGISRTAFQIEQARQKNDAVVHLFDCGDGLFGSTSIPEAAVPQQERKAKALAESWKAMGLDARATGPLDDVRGVPFRKSLGLKEIQPMTVVDGVAMVTAPTVAEAEALAKKSGARFVVAAIPLPFGELLAAAGDAPTVDLLIASHSKDEFAAEESRMAGATSKVVQIQSKGRSLLRVDLAFHGAGRVTWLRGDAEREHELATLDERIELLRAQVREPMLGEEMKALRKAKLEDVIGRREALAAAAMEIPQDRGSAVMRFVPIESTLPKDAKVEAIETAYDRDVGLINLEWAKAHGTSCPSATAEKPGIVGSAKCITCHHEEGAVWRATKHPSAYLALKEKGKENHLDCVGCHVTGWQQPSGVCRIDQTTGRTEVGCESCHGPGSAHVEAPSKKTIHREVPKETCVGCHDRENSPSFDYATFVEKVLGPGHGR